MITDDKQNVKKGKNKSFEKSLFSTEFFFAEYVIVVFLLLLALNPFASGEGLPDVLVLVFLFYLLSLFLIRKVILFPGHLVLFYPTRFICRRRKIDYPEIEVVKYSRGSSAYSLPEIQIRIKKRLLPVLFVSLFSQKRERFLYILEEHNVKIVRRS